MMYGFVGAVVRDGWDFVCSHEPQLAGLCLSYCGLTYY